MYVLLSLSGHAMKSCYNTEKENMITTFVNPLLLMIFQMLSSLLATDEQIEQSGKLEVTSWQRVENIAIKVEIALFSSFFVMFPKVVTCRQWEVMG